MKIFRSNVLLLLCWAVVCQGETLFRGGVSKIHNGDSVKCRDLQLLAEDSFAWAEMAPNGEGLDDQKLAMVEFYFATGGPAWFNQTDWYVSTSTLSEFRFLRLLAC